MENFKQKLNHIRAFIFDMDGVLTDGTIIIMPDGEHVRTMNVRDGYALQLAVKRGYKVAIISGGRSQHVVKRLQGLGVHDVYMGAENKVSVYQEWLQTHALKPEETLFMGDDMPDYQVMQLVGIPVCPVNAVADIKNIAMYTSPYGGGLGCARDVIEQTLRLHGKWYAENEQEQMPASR